MTAASSEVDKVGNTFLQVRTFVFSNYCLFTSLSLAVEMHIYIDTVQISDTKNEIISFDI